MGDSDAQFSVRYVLKPYLGFETVYEGKSVDTARIALTPDGQALDKYAGHPGYDTRLVAALPVPLGARVLIKIPVIFATVGLGGAREYYAYNFIWRERSLADYVIGGITPYHNAQDRSGVPDGSSPRNVISATAQAIIYNQVEPPMTGVLPATGRNAVGHLRTEFVVPIHPEEYLIYNPGGAFGAIQQGVAPVDAGAYVTKPFWQVYEIQAAGDELLMTVSRVNDNGGSATWAFTGSDPDRDFSRFFGEGLQAGGYPDLGVHVLVGKAP